MGKLNNKKIIKKSAHDWTKHLNIQIIDNNNKVWKNNEEFHDKLIDLETFINLACQCVIVSPDSKNRQDIWKMRRELVKNID